MWTVRAIAEQPVTNTRGPPIASVTMVPHEPRTIQLVFTASEEMSDARLSLSLPPGVELVGYARVREIHWTTTLRPGKNVLPLELVVQEGSGGDLLTRLRHGDRRKTFRTRVVVRAHDDDVADDQGSTPE